MNSSNIVQLEQKVEALQTKNVNEDKQIFENIEADIVRKKIEIRNTLMPNNNQEDERIKEIANKLNEHIQTGFNKFSKVEEILNYLEPAFQRGKVDKAYGRALVLLVENTMIEQVKIQFDNSKDKARLMNAMLDKLIELSSELMPDDYRELLKLEKRFFNILYSQS
ncbi:hypothetical protein [Staphylococcus edaphicus]|uniref:Uncharacterized protein n=1 Tax=Staphylococcus edaphicus TaxID=1955013 RepID=A0A2C6WM32_9STAP|nr:hypothetical protein [Staphylococcus edaphicus]PHK48806.1 hypothetical protein BTJ66_11405 [Staphylococcus edaphicus]UQW80917.1 hypothetical protein MNY58_10040 [Staphylococcus edaphicus]